MTARSTLMPNDAAASENGGCLMTETSPTTEFYRVDSDRTAWRQVGQEGVVLDLQSSVYFGLNRSAGTLWPRLLAGSTVSEMVDVLLIDSPELDRRTAASEVTSFLKALADENLLIAGSGHA